MVTVTVAVAVAVVAAVAARPLSGEQSPSCGLLCPFQAAFVPITSWARSIWKVTAAPNAPRRPAGTGRAAGSPHGFWGNIS